MERQVFTNVWDAIEDTPADAVHMTMRSELLSALRQCVEGWNIPRAEAAHRLGITQPRLQEIVRGQINAFGLDALIGLAQRAGLTLKLEIGVAA